jgi:hypothetical protein
MGFYPKARLFNVDLPAADKDILDKGITTLADCSQFRIHVACSKAGRFYMTRTSGGATIREDLFGGNITADSGNTVSVPARLGTTYNFQFSVTNGKVLILQVDEESPFKE